MYKKALNNIREKLKSRGGFGILEFLIVVMIVMLSAQGMAEGIAFSSRNFKIQMQNSEAKVLFSTLEDAIDYELEHTKDIEYSTGPHNGTNGTKYYDVTGFISPTYALEGGHTYFESVDKEGGVVDSGYIAIGYMSDKFNGSFITPVEAYTYGTKAKVSDLRLNQHKDDGPWYFSYKLTLYRKNGTSVIVKDTLSTISNYDFQVDTTAKHITVKTDSETP